jgi:hypothetical protein
VSLTLRDYQQPHFTRLLCSLLTNGYAHDGAETGTGKTFTGAALVKILGGETLIVAPLSVLPAWQEALEGFGATNYTLMNYEKVWRRLGEVKPWGAGSFFRYHKKWDNVVFDEAHRGGSETSLNSKMIIAAKRQGARILSLSATVAENPMQLKAWGFVWGLHDLKNWTEFLLKCQCKPGTFGGWTFSSKAHPMILIGLHEEIYGKGKGSRMIKKEIPGFPKTQLEVRMLGCPDKQLTKLGAELLAYYNERTVKAHKIAASVKKAKEDAARKGVEVDPKAANMDLARVMLIRQALETAKVPLIGEMIEDALETSKVAVFCNFNRTIDELLKLAEKRGWKYGVIRGDQTKGTGSERETVIKDFQANRLDCVFCNIMAGGVAVSLHDPVTQYPRTSLICPTFSGTDLKQVLGRVQRAEGGFSQQLLIYFDDSFEGHIARTVKQKLNAIDLINDGDLQGVFKEAA